MKTPLTAALAFAVAALSPLVGGCSLLAHDTTAEVHFVVKPRSDGTFASFNGLTIDDPTGTTDALLLSVTFDTTDPPDLPDLTYMTSVAGTGTNGDLRALFCDQYSFPAGEASVPGTVQFHDNIVPFFAGDSIELDWSGTVNESYPFPEQGITVRAVLQVSPQ